MRLDKFLKVSRLIKRRTVANSISDSGKILVNDKVAKPSKVVKVGDIITLNSSFKPFRVKILHIPSGSNVSLELSKELYELLE